MSPAEVIKKRGREREQGVMADHHYRERETDREGGFGPSKKQNGKRVRRDATWGFAPAQSAGRGAWRVNAPWFGGRVCLLKRQTDQSPFIPTSTYY